MKTRHILLILFVFTVHLTYGQKNKTPKNISEAISILTTDCPDSLKAIIIRTGNDSLIKLCHPWDGEYKTIYKWIERDNKKSKIRKYLEKKGVSSNQHQQTVILLAFKKTLISEPYDENSILRPYQVIEAKWAKEDSVRYTTDSLRGVYIPKDLEDCFKQINQFWSDSTKMKVKQLTEEEFSGRAHMHFGMWMRNNWQLWGGSRLSKFFNDMGVYHPDGISGIILDSYHRYLTGSDIKLEEQIKFYQDYWRKANDEKKKK